MRRSMAALRALAYFFEEALQSLWRSRLIAALSVGTIAVSLFVVGVFLEDGVEERIRKSLEDRLREDAAVE